MPSLTVFAACLAALLSAAGLYAGSRHCRWPSWRRLGHAGTWAGLGLAAVSLALWIAVLGAGAGSCAMLGTWMLGMMALPYMAALSAAPADGQGGGNGNGGGG